MGRYRQARLRGLLRSLVKHERRGPRRFAIIGDVKLGWAAALLTLAGCAGVTGGASYEPLETRSFAAPPDAVWAAAEKAIADLGLQVQSEDRGAGVLTAAKNAGRDFVARKARLTIKPQGGRTMVGVESEASSSSPFFSARPEGFNRELLNEIQRILAPSG